MNLYRRLFLQSNNLLFVKIPFAEDVIFSVHSLLKANKFLIVPTIFYVYRHNDTSAMGTMNLTKFKSMNVVIANLKELRESNSLSDAVAKNLMKQYLLALASNYGIYRITNQSIHTEKRLFPI